MLFDQKGFNLLDFAEAKKIAGMVKFDIMVWARKKKSCGPGCDYLVNDKRYYVSLLIKHIDTLLHDEASKLSTEVLEWQEKAKAAAREYSEIEQLVSPLPQKRSAD